MGTFFTDRSGEGEFLDEKDPKNRIKNVKIGFRNLGIANASTKQERIDAENKSNLDMHNFLNNPHIKAEIRQQKLDNMPKPSTEKQDFIDFADKSFDGKSIEAKHGYMGMVNHKTMFTVGEQKKKEFVSVKPKKDDFNMFSTKKKKNIFDVGF